MRSVRKQDPSPSRHLWRGSDRTSVANHGESLDDSPGRFRENARVDRYYGHQDRRRQPAAGGSGEDRHGEGERPREEGEAIEGAAAAGVTRAKKVSDTFFR